MQQVEAIIPPAHRFADAAAPAQRHQASFRRLADDVIPSGIIPFGVIWKWQVGSNQLLGDAVRIPHRADVAKTLDISRTGFYKLISRGKLTVIRHSERGLRVSPLAHIAYRRRLQTGLQPGGRLEVEMPQTDPVVPRKTFESATEMTPAAWQQRWEAGRLADTTENAALAMDADWLQSYERASQRQNASAAHEAGQTQRRIV